MTMLKTPELSYRPTREGGEDQLHSHMTFNPSAIERESCGACAQLANDFTWAIFNDATAGETFAARETVLEDVREELRDRVLVA